MEPFESFEDRDRASVPDVLKGNVAPWELVEAGRYRPLRIKGSLRGRELG